MKKYLVLLIWLFGLFFVCGQEPAEEKELDRLIDEFFMEDDTINELIASLSNFQFLYVSLTYTNDTYFSGRDIGIDQFNISPQITYMHSNGLFASVSGIYYSAFFPNWDVTTASLGYSKNIGKKKLFKYDVSYSKYFYANAIDNMYSNTLNIGVGVQNKNRTLGTQFSGSYLFGKEQSYQITSLSYVTLNIVRNKKMKLKLRPQISVVAGKQTVELARVFPQTDEPIYIENEVFSLINTQMNLPLLYNTNSFDFEVGYTINLPTPIGDETSLNTTSFFNVSVAYLIDL